MSIDRENIHSVLVYVGLDRLGDGLLKLPFARGLRTAFPNAHLTWFAGKETSVYAGVLAPLVADVIDEVIEYGGVGLHPSETLKRQPLKDRRFDIVIDTQRIFLDQPIGLANPTRPIYFSCRQVLAVVGEARKRL